MKIRTALALAALSVTPAFATESAPVRPVADETMTAMEKRTIDSLEKEIAMLQQAVEQLRKASAERALIQAEAQQGDRASSWGLWP